MCHDLASYLRTLGHIVTVLCPQPSRPLNADYSRNIKSDRAVVTSEDGIKIVRLPSFTAPKSTLLPRMWESLSFGQEASKYLAKEKLKPDVLYVNSWPMFSQAIITRYAKKNDVPVVLQIMDIYPEAFTSKLPFLLRYVIHTPLKWFDAQIARSAVKVVVISENMRQAYVGDRQIPDQSVVTIPTWQDEAVFHNITSRSESCLKYGVPDDLFTFLFLGNIGPVAGVDFLIRAFSEARITNTQLLIVGDGTAKSDCVALAGKLKQSRVYFISDPDAANVPILQNMAHVCMLPMKRGAGMSSIPSKLPSYQFSAKPIIATVDLESDTARFVQQAECGWVGEPEDLSWLVNAMREVSRLPLEQLEIIGARGKKFGLEHFSKSTGVVRLAESIIQAACGGKA